MRSRKEIVGELLALQSERKDDMPEFLVIEVMLDIRDAVTTWIAGDLNARSTAQQYRNAAVDAFVKLLQGIDKKLERLEVRGRP